MRLRLRRYMMSRRAGETSNSLFYTSEKSIWRKFSVFEELAWERKGRSKHSLCRRKSQIIFGRGSEAKHHLRQVRNPVRARQSCLERGFERAMKTINHSISLRVKTCRHDPRNAKDTTNLQPKRGCKLRSLIRGKESWDSEP